MDYEGALFVSIIWLVIFGYYWRENHNRYKETKFWKDKNNDEIKLYREFNNDVKGMIFLANSVEKLREDYDKRETRLLKDIVSSIQDFTNGNR